MAKSNKIAGSESLIGTAIRELHKAGRGPEPGGVSAISWNSPHFSP